MYLRRGTTGNKPSLIMSTISLEKALLLYNVKNIFQEQKSRAPIKTPIPCREPPVTSTGAGGGRQRQTRPAKSPHVSARHNNHVSEGASLHVSGVPEVVPRGHHSHDAHYFVDYWASVNRRGVKLNFFVVWFDEKFYSRK